MIKIIHSSIICKWANLQNQQGIKSLLLPLYTENAFYEWSDSGVPTRYCKGDNVFSKINWRVDGIIHIFF